MDIDQLLIGKLRVLPPDKKQEALDFIEFLEKKDRAQAQHPRRSFEGLWEHLDIDITEKDIEESRREMWGNFPRENIL